MRFYTQQHPHYCGIDLHARTMYMCVLNQAGAIVLHRNMKSDPESFLKAVDPFRQNLVVAVECIFTWYWLADLCAEERIAFVLGHALYMKAIHGGKAAGGAGFGGARRNYIERPVLAAEVINSHLTAQKLSTGKGFPMLKARTDPYSQIIVDATLRGIGIYLDNHSFIRLSQDKSGLRTRFLNLFGNGAELLFSLSNSVEFSGSHDGSLDLIRAFLDEIGPYWFPLELDPATVVEREAQGHEIPFVSEEFIATYAKHRIKNYDGGPIIDMSASFFKLGEVTAGWVDSQRDQIRARLKRMDKFLISQIEEGRNHYRKDRRWLDNNFPAIPFDVKHAATFVYRNLIRHLVSKRGDNLKPHDGIDFCHAVIGAAAANFMTLDKHWKGRIEALPEPNRVAKVYYEPELQELISDVENALADIKREPGGEAFLRG